MIQYRKVANLQQDHHHDHWPLTTVNQAYLLLAQAHLLEEKWLQERGIKDIGMRL